MKWPHTNIQHWDGPWGIVTVPLTGPAWAGAVGEGASISFHNDLLTHCVSVAWVHDAMTAHPATHDENTTALLWKTVRKKDYARWTLAHNPTIRLWQSGAGVTSHRRYYGKQQQVDVRSLSFAPSFHHVTHQIKSVHALLWSGHCTVFLLTKVPSYAIDKLYKPQLRNYESVK